MHDTPTAATARPTGPLDLFLTFSAIAASGYGGTLAWAHRTLVERKQWLTHEEFAELFGVGQMLPGPNICNLAALFGHRHAGLAGASAAVAGLIALPLALMMILGALYARFGSDPFVERALRGMTAVAAGLVIATGLKLARSLGRRRMAWLFATLAFIAVGVLRWPLFLVLAALAPAAVAVAWQQTAAR